MSEDNKMLSKMNVGSIRAVVKSEATEAGTPWVRIYGVVTGTKVKKNLQGDPIIALVGDFEGVNLADGVVSRSGVLYLPGGFHDQLVSAASQEGASNIQFALEIGVKKSGNPAGYEYVAKQLVKPTGADPLDALRASIPAVKALPKGKAA